MHIVCRQTSLKGLIKLSNLFQFVIFKENYNGEIKILCTGKGWLTDERITTSRLK